MRINNYRIRIIKSYYKDEDPDRYIISPFIYVDYYSSIYYYEKRYTIGLSWLIYDVSIDVYINK